MHPRAIIKRRLTIIHIIFFLMSLNACFMMPFIINPIYRNLRMNNYGDPKVNRAIVEIIEESVSVLMVNLGSYEPILIGETKTVGDLISHGRFRQIFIETLRSKSGLQVLDREDRKDSPLEPWKWPKLKSQEFPAVLNIQFHHAGDKIWLAQQLLDMRTNRILWSGINDKSLPRAFQIRDGGTNPNRLNIETY